MRCMVEKRLNNSSRVVNRLITSVECSSCLKRVNYSHACMVVGKGLTKHVYIRTCDQRKGNGGSWKRVK